MIQQDENNKRNTYKRNDLPEDIGIRQRDQSKRNEYQRQRQGIRKDVIGSPLNPIGIMPREILRFVVWTFTFQYHAPRQPEEGKVGVLIIKGLAHLRA